MTGDADGMSKDNKVTLNYTFGEKTGTLTCKWQGSSSLAYPKKNYTVEFDTAFEAKAGWGSQKKYCLKAYWVDASFLRNQLGAVMWGMMVKSRSGAPAQLASLPNGGAIDGFPVWVTLNGNPMGLYMFNIPKDAWMFGMTGTTAGEAILCSVESTFSAPAACDGSDFTIEYSASEDTSSVIASFNALISAVSNVTSADDLPALEAVLDIESAIDYYVLAALICHDDGIVRNSLFATLDGTKWLPSAYDMDSCFGNSVWGNDYGWANDFPSFTDLGNAHKLLGVIRTYYADRIRQRFTALRGWLFGDINIQAEAYKLAVQLPRVLLDEEYRLWPQRPGTLTNDLRQILDYLRLRISHLDYNVTLLQQWNRMTEKAREVKIHGGKRKL